MENILSALQVNTMLLALAMAITFIVMGITESSDDKEKLLELRIENAFFCISGLAIFLIFWLI